ncbi:unnamed protein product [Trichobilharzia regenti]|nr:unnamed protein product [Trichobilharzia regenti]
MEQSKLRQHLQQVDQMNYDLANLRIELVELTRLTTIKSDEREQKSRDVLTAQSRYLRIQDDIKSKQLQINEYEKSLNSTQVIIFIIEINISSNKMCIYFFSLLYKFQSLHFHHQLISR